MQSVNNKRFASRLSYDKAQLMSCASSEYSDQHCLIGVYIVISFVTNNTLQRRVVLFSLRVYFIFLNHYRYTCINFTIAIIVSVLTCNDLVFVKSLYGRPSDCHN